MKFIKRKGKRDAKIISYINSLTPEEILEKEKYFKKKVLVLEGFGFFLLVISILAIIILANWL